jgi:hypothetical protein
MITGPLLTGAAEAELTGPTAIAALTSATAHKRLVLEVLIALRSGDRLITRI